MEAPTTNIPANKTTVESDKPENTCFAGIKPNRPQEIAPAVAVIAKGISSVTNSKIQVKLFVKMNNYNKFYLKMLPSQQRRFSKFAIV